jgi:hypothetical protein
MLFSSLLNFWLLITTAIDPGLKPHMFTGGDGINVSQFSVKRHEPLELPVLVFSQKTESEAPEPKAVADYADKVGVRHRNAAELEANVNAAVQWLENCVAGAGTWARWASTGGVEAVERVEGFSKALIRDAERGYLNLQAELIIIRLGRAAERAGLESHCVDPYWAHYELLDQRKVVLVETFFRNIRTAGAASGEWTQRNRLAMLWFGTARKTIEAMSTWLERQWIRVENSAGEFCGFEANWAMLREVWGSAGQPRNEPVGRVNCGVGGTTDDDFRADRWSGAPWEGGCIFAE